MLGFWLATLSTYFGERIWDPAKPWFETHGNLLYASFMRRNYFPFNCEASQVISFVSSTPEGVCLASHLEICKDPS
jgi:hypothetical protein